MLSALSLCDAHLVSLLSKTIGPFIGLGTRIMILMMMVVMMIMVMTIIIFMMFEVVSLCCYIRWLLPVNFARLACLLLLPLLPRLLLLRLLFLFMPHVLDLLWLNLAPLFMGA